MKLKIYILAAIVSTGIAYGQDTLTNNVTITYEQETACLTCFESSIIKDSIIVEQDDVINLKDSLILSNHLEYERVNSELIESNKQAMKVQRYKWIRNSIFSFLGGYILHIFV